MKVLDQIEAVSRAAREEFEQRVQETGLKVQSTGKSEYAILASDNEGRDVEAVLTESGLPFNQYGSGTYITDVETKVVEAVEKGLGIKIQRGNAVASIH